MNSTKDNKPKDENKEEQNGQGISSQRDNAPEKKKKSKKGLIIGAVILAACIAFGIILATVIIPSVNSETGTGNESGDTGSSGDDSMDGANYAVGDTIIFGNYEQDNDLSNGKEPIEWIVLSCPERTNKILVVSKYALDRKPYNESRTEITWDQSSIRKWLNQQFLNDAFTVEEQGKIRDTDTSPVEGFDSPFVIIQSKPTVDKVFLPGLFESSVYIGKSNLRFCQATPYAINQGAGGQGTRRPCHWWLKSSDLNLTESAVITLIGANSRRPVDSGDIYVRPAMWIDLNFNNGDDCDLNDIGDDSEDDPSDGANYAVGDTITFGNYQQSNDSSKGKEPIEWVVLEKKDGKMLAVSKYALDCQPYNTSHTETTWDNCSLRKWLNQQFFNDAFTVEEQEKIYDTDTSPNKMVDKPLIVYKTKNTVDKVFLLSSFEWGKYVFSSADLKCCKATSYAYAKVPSGYATRHPQPCQWWLRTPSESFKLCNIVTTDGGESSVSVDSPRVCVRPAMWIDLNF